MLRSNRSSSSLTPIETNTDTEYDLGCFDNPTSTKSQTEVDTKRGFSNEGTNRVKIRVMDSDRNEAEEIYFFDDFETRDGVKDDDDDDLTDYDITHKRNGAEKDGDGDVNTKYSIFRGDVKDGDRDGDTFQSDRSISPIKQQMERGDETDDKILSSGNDIDNKSPRDNRSNDGSAEIEKNQDNDRPIGVAGPSETQHDMNNESNRTQNNSYVSIENKTGNVYHSDIVTNAEEKPYVDIASGHENQDMNKSQSPKTEIINKTIDRNESETNRDKDGNGVTGEHLPPDSQRSNKVTNSDNILTDAFFDREDSVEMSYFASFGEFKSSASKTTLDKTLEGDDEDNTKHIDRHSLQTTNDSETTRKICDNGNRGDDSEKGGSAVCEPGNVTDEAILSTSGPEVSAPNVVKHDPDEECSNNSLKTTTLKSQGTDRLVEDCGCENNKAEYDKSTDAGNISPQELQSKKSVDDSSLLDNDGQSDKLNDHKRDRDSPTNAEKTIVQPEAKKDVPVANEKSNRNLLYKDVDGNGDGNGGVINEEDNDNGDDDDGGDEEAEIPEINESNSLSEPDEQSILRVYISKNEEEQPEFDITSEILQMSEDTQSNDNFVGYSGTKHPNKRNKSSRNKLGKQKDKKKNLSSPYSNLNQSFQGDVKPIDRLKHGPYAEVFKRDAPKTPLKPKNGLENIKKNKPTEKSKSENKDKKGIASSRSPLKSKAKGKAIQLTNKRKLKKDPSSRLDAAPTPVSPNRTQDDSEEESLDWNEGSNEDLPALENRLETNQPSTHETDADQSAEAGPDVSNDSSKEVAVPDNLQESTESGLVPQVITESRNETLSRNKAPQKESKEETILDITTDENTANDISKPKHTDDNTIMSLVETQPKESLPDTKISPVDVADANATFSSEKEIKTAIEDDTKATTDKDSKSNSEKDLKITTNKTNKAITDKQKQPAIQGSSAKKKIIISSPKTTAKMAIKSKQISEKAKDSPKTQNTKLTQKPDQKTKERKISDTKSPANDSNTNRVDAIEPTTITVIDETSELDERVSGRAGRLIINNIKNKLRKNSIKRHASNSSAASVQLITNSRPSSPDGLNTSIPQQGGRTAYKTQSMSSLQVPGHLSTSNPWDPTKEEDAVSIGSRRPSMDSVSRKSIDYRIRNTTMVIQPHNDEKPKSVFTSDESYIQSAVPCLPMSLAVFCLFLNVVMPGSGTIISGLSVLCCGHSRLSNKEDQMLNSLCANLFVGIAQLFTVSFLLVGWFWSVSWGIQMVSVSARHRKELRQQREKDLQAMALSAFGSPKRMNLFST